MRTNKLKSIFSGLLLGYWMMSCTGAASPETFVVSQTAGDDAQKNSAIPPLPKPGKAFYFPFNFIIDSSGHVFFYQQDINWNNDATNSADSPPAFIGLRPKDIIQVPDEAIEAFIDSNILSRDSLKRYISIASAKDTIQSAALSSVIAICRNPTSHIRWNLRLLTQEETVVLAYKKRQADYDPTLIKWDSTKIQRPINR